MRSPFIGTVTETANFHHLPLSLPEFARLLADPKFDTSTEFRHIRDRYASLMGIGDRFRKIAKFCAGKPAVPAEVRDEALRYSRELTFSLNVFRSKIVRGQSHGSLDSSKLARLAAPGLSPREFDRLAATAYRRREHVQAATAKPRLAIVGDMNNDIRSSNPGYMKKLGRLAYIVAEAAKLTGVEVAMFGSRGFTSEYDMDDNGGARVRSALGLPRNKRLHVATTLKGWGDDVDGGAYGVFTDATTYAFSTILLGATAMIVNDGNGMGSSSGCGGIEYARAQGANMVIAFGSFAGCETADLTLSPRDNVETVIKAIVAHINSNKAA